MIASLPTLFLDAAVPMYASGRPHPYQSACQWIMAEVARGGLQVAIDTEIIQEILHRYAALHRHADAIQLSTQVLQNVPQILSVTAADVRLAVSLYPHYIHRGVATRDLIHAAVMQNNGLTHILSPDAHFDLIAGIVRIDPLALHVQAGQPPP